ncbi:MAG: oligopeptidase A, partial [Xanthomonadales bacterium]|nr:oligopeptidase A [Xanthomonadales bacterium]
MTNPLLQDLPLPDFSALLPEHVEPAITTRLQQWRERVELILADADADSFGSAIAPLEQAADALWRSFSPVSHLHSVADSPELRAAYLAALEQITAFSAELSQNRALYQRFAEVAERPDFAQLSVAERAVVNDGLRDFRLGGVALEEPARSRFREISTELARLQAEFEQAVTDASDAWQLPITDSEQLAGLPEAALTAAAEEARQRELDGWVLTLRAPCYIAVMTHARNRELRATFYRAWQTRASDQGDNPAFDNSERMERILALRHEAAGLLGFPSAAHRSLATKMAKSPNEVIDFLTDLAARARPAAALELDDLRQFAADELGIADLQPWDLSFAAERLKESRYGLKEEDLKPYLPMPRVLEGLFERCKSLFGVHIVERPEVATWHPDARYYEVLDQGTDLPRAGFYLDPYARAAKRGGAWMDVCGSRARFDGHPRLPVAYLTC